MAKEYVQHPKGANKFLTVGDLLDFADELRRDEVPRERVVLAEGMISLRNEMRGLRIKKG